MAFPNQFFACFGFDDIEFSRIFRNQNFVEWRKYLAVEKSRVLAARFLVDYIWLCVVFNN